MEEQCLEPRVLRRKSGRYVAARENRADMWERYPYRQPLVPERQRVPATESEHSKLNPEGRPNCSRIRNFGRWFRNSAFGRWLESQQLTGTTVLKVLLWFVVLGLLSEVHLGLPCLVLFLPYCLRMGQKALRQLCPVTQRPPLLGGENKLQAMNLQRTTSGLTCPRMRLSP